MLPMRFSNNFDGGNGVGKTPPRACSIASEKRSPEVARRMIALFREIRPPERADHELKPHETRLLKLLVEGHNYKTAVAELGVTAHTVSSHLRRIYDKLQVHSKTEAVSKALRNRLV